MNKEWQLVAALNSLIRSEVQGKSIFFFWEGNLSLEGIFDTNDFYMHFKDHFRIFVDCTQLVLIDLYIRMFLKIPLHFISFYP